MRRRFTNPVALSALASGMLTLWIAAGSARGQTASALFREGQPLPGAPDGHLVNSINNPATNHAGGYGALVNTSDGVITLSHAWGNSTGGVGTVIRTEGTFGIYTQSSYESFWGLGDDGEVAYSPTVSGGVVGSADSVWLDDVPVAVEGEAHPALAGQFWVFGSRPGVTADGIPYFVGGISDTSGGSSQNRGLFFGVDGGTVLLLGGQSLPNLPLALTMTTTNPGFSYRLSALGTHYIAPVQMVPPTATDSVMVIDGSGLLLDGSLVQEGMPIPAAVGGMPGENWANFDFMGIAESGDYFFSGDSSAATTADEFILKNGVMLYRDGTVLDGETLQGDMEAAYMNDDGDIAFIWDVQANTVEALYLNDDLLVKEGDLVDLDGDGTVEANSILVNFTGIASLAISDRGAGGAVDVYFVADIDVNGTPTASDDIEGFFRITATVAVPVEIASANPPLDNPYVGGQQAFRDVLDTGSTAMLTAGIGAAGTGDQGSISYSPISVTFTSAPLTIPDPGNVVVSCTDAAGNGDIDCPTVDSVSGSDAGPYSIVLSSAIPPGECTTISLAGVDNELQYQSQPGNVSLDALTNTQDLLNLVLALNNGAANMEANLARYNVNRSAGATPVNTQDLLRLIQLLNGALTTQVFNGATVAACP